jgi:hypothetical protein
MRPLCGSRRASELDTACSGAIIAAPRDFSIKGVSIRPAIQDPPNFKPEEL